MGLLDEALSRLLIGRDRPPSSFNDVVEVFGDMPRRQNPGIARVLSGVDGPLPAKGTAQRIGQRGAWMRLTAEIKVSQVWKTHTMPADAGGLPRFQYLPGPAMGSAITAWMDGDLDGAGGQLLRAFFDQYWGDPEPAQTGRIIRVELRE
jgi:hypothetical protein